MGESDRHVSVDQFHIDTEPADTFRRQITRISFESAILSDIHWPMESLDHRGDVYVSLHTCSLISFHVVSYLQVCSAIEASFEMDDWSNKATIIFSFLISFSFLVILQDSCDMSDVHLHGLTVIFFLNCSRILTAVQHLIVTCRCLLSFLFLSFSPFFCRSVIRLMHIIRTHITGSVL